MTNENIIARNAVKSDELFVLDNGDYLTLLTPGPMSILSEVHFDDAEHGEDGYTTFYLTVDGERVQTARIDTVMYGAVWEVIEEGLEKFNSN